MKPSELLSDRSKWTQDAFARDAKGYPVAATGPSATCFCLLGALRKCGHDINDLGGGTPYRILRDIVVAQTGFTTITIFNDSPNTTFDDIKKVLQLANL